MSIADYEFCFVGAGVSTAIHLLTHRDFFKNKRVLILEAGPDFGSEKTFCSFSAHEIPTQKELLFRSFEASGKDFYKSYEVNTPYRCLEARRLFFELDQFIKSSPFFKIEFGQTVDRLRDCGGLFEVLGRTVEFVFDARPPAIRGPIWYQHFMGWELDFKRPHQINTPILMEIDPSFQEGLKFFYLIPKSQKKILVELTYFSEQVLDDLEYERELASFLKAKKWAEYQKVFWERGCIPLVTINPPIFLPKNYRALGIRAGHLRASTGYSVWRSFLCSRERGPLLENTFDLRWCVIQWLDNLFLKVLQLEPRYAAELFTLFFRRLGGEAISSFLSESPSWRSLLSVIKTMPKLRFVAAVFRSSKFINRQKWRKDF
jgi:lycopene beta-cyclase